MGYPIYIPAADLITMDALIQSGKTPVMSALDKNTVDVTSVVALYAKDFNSRLSDSRFIQLLPNHTYTIIVTSSSAMTNWNYIITYEAWQAVVGTTTAPANKQFRSGGTSYQTTVKTGASGKLFIFVGGTKTQFKVQIK